MLSCVFVVFASEVPWTTSHVQDPEDAPQECAVSQGPYPAVPRRQR